MNQKQRTAYSSEFMRINRKYEDKYFPKVQKALKSKASSLKSDIKANGVQAARNTLATDLTNPELSKVVKGLYLEVGLRHARKTHRSIKQMPRIEKKGFGFNATWVAFILNYLQNFLTQKITFAVNETTRNALLEILDEGIAEGLGVDDMVNRIEEEETQLTRVQAARIVRTEVNRSANVGTMAAVDTSDFEMQKEWISAGDFRVRGKRPKDHADHVHLNGQVVDFTMKFKDRRSGDELEFPGDPNASAATTVNCRCTAAPIAKRDERGNLIPKPQPAISTPVISLVRPPMAARPAFGLNVGK